jgi:type IV pilus assembly protein PilW
MFNPKYKRATQRHQGGFTLMELMVGLSIGLLVVIAALGGLVVTQSTSGVVGDSARLQQTADNTFRLLGFQVQKAGAFLVGPTAANPTTLSFSGAFTGFNPVSTGAVNQIWAINGLEGASGTAPDTLRVSYEDDGDDRDCLGNRPDAAQIGIRVDSQYALDTVKKELTCLGAQVAAGTQPVADGVEDFQVTYGVQTVIAGALQYRFYTANQILDWTNIQAVNICLQLVGEKSGNPNPVTAIKGCRNQDVTSDGYLRKVFQRTFSIRNALL